jgi:hypothetical protein
MVLKPMDNGYLKDQGYLFLFDTAVAIEVIDHLFNVWEELQKLEKFLKPKVIIFFQRDLLIPLLIHPMLPNNLKKREKGHMTYESF